MQSKQNLIMQLSFHGAARTVTGSKHLLTLDNGFKVLLDCGLFQGMGQQTDELNRNFGFDPATVGVLLLSHAHIDHSGLIPKLVKEGFRGQIICTRATKDLAAILLKDSAFIQKEDTKYINKKRLKKDLPLFEPMYSVKDTDEALGLFETIEYGQWLSINNDIDVLYTDAGHIIGSAAISLKIKENGKISTLTFSGDVGRFGDIILRSPQKIPAADYIICESTYGDKLHKEVAQSSEALLDWITKTCVEKQGKLIIPAFSVGRTQEILYWLNKLELEGRLPNVTYYVDSPLSLEATDVVRKHAENFNDTVKQVLLNDNDPFTFKGVKYVDSVEASKAINFDKKPCVIISSSGMAEAGRVKHHIKNNISDSKNTILMVGYASPFSLAGKLLNGVKQVNIYGDDLDVKAEIGQMQSMSAHADYEDLLQFLKDQNPSLVKKLFLVHGEYDVQTHFANTLKEKKYNVEIPGMNYAIKLV
jgi:metallo-beta-lactamase family protein